MPACATLYRGHGFPAAVIAHALRLYLRFALSYRDVEELLAERGSVVSDEAVRRWVATFGARYAEELRRRATPRPDLAHGRDGDTVGELPPAASERIVRA